MIIALLVWMIISFIIHIVQIEKKDEEIKRLNELLRKKDNVFICISIYKINGSIHNWIERVIAENEAEARKWFLNRHADIEKFRQNELTIINAVAELN